jgi:hypothetical protein
VRAEAVDCNTDSGLSQKVFGRVDSRLEVAEELEQGGAGLALLHGLGDRLAAQLDLFGVHGHGEGGDDGRGSLVVWDDSVYGLWRLRNGMRQWRAWARSRCQW